MRQKLKNSKDYAESPEFLPALGLFIFIPSSLDYNFFGTQIYIYTDKKPIAETNNNKECKKKIICQVIVSKIKPPEKLQTPCLKSTLYLLIPLYFIFLRLKIKYVHTVESQLSELN